MPYTNVKFINAILFVLLTCLAASQAAASNTAVQNLSEIEQQLQQAIKDIDNKSEKPLDTNSDIAIKQEKITPSINKPRTLSKKLTTELLENMIWVEGGSFEMGSRLATAANREKPAHMVTLDGFYMGSTEVIQQLFEVIMGWNESYFPCAKCPVNNISWFNMQLFIERLNQATGKLFRLPTEAEWAYAAKGGQRSQNYLYSGSNNIDEVAWYAGNAENRSHPVATKKPNELGLYDMTGNLWEFCQDTLKRHLYTEEARVNPLYLPNKDPRHKAMKVLRGSGYEFAANESEVFRRDGATNNVRMPDIGFRLALTKK